MPEVVAGTRYGQVRGRLEDGVAAFKGIPYAAAPIGPLRMRPPSPPEPWSGERPCLDYGATVPHPPYAPPFDELLREPFNPGDEWLNLNVWTPDLAGGGLPVMVWIHGGAFTNGTGAHPMYDGSRFARAGVVLVTINYRLGVDGFALLSDGEANLGMQDQVAALGWVQDNIRQFGGDPARVTIFGESAGGMSVVTLMAMPSARGLFRRVIAQSGAGQSARTRAVAERVSLDLAAHLGIEPTRSAIEKVPLDQLFAAQQQLSIAYRAASMAPGASDTPRIPFAPVVDGAVLPQAPHAALAAGAGRDVELLIGSNRDEQNLWLVPTGVIDRLDEPAFRTAALAAGLDGERALEVYRAARPDATPGELFSALMTDQVFRVPAIAAAEAQIQGGGQAWMYEFAWPSPEFGGRLGACHALEIAFVFDNLDRGRRGLSGGGPPQDLARAMHGAWVRFATEGDPGWPSYDQARRATVQFWPGMEVVDDLRRAERELWSAEVAAPRA